MRQIQFEKTAWKHRFTYGGSLRGKRRGRGERPLSTKTPIHLVLKANADMIRGGFRAPRRFKLIHELTTRYSKRFFVKIEQLSIQGDHIHFVLRISRRSSFQNFLRVLAGQISQRQVTDTPLKKGKLWQHRPFTRVVQGLKAYLTVRNYVQLNEQEAVGIIPYRKERLRGLSAEEMEWLWT